MAEMNCEGCNSTMFKSLQQSIAETLCHMTMKEYQQDVTSTAAYSRQQAHDSNLQEIMKKREMRCQLEDVEALLRKQTEYSSGKLTCRT